MLKKISSKPTYRSAVFDRQDINAESRTVALAFSSEEPYERWWGKEILDHSPDSVRLGRLNDGGALLVDHDASDHVGVVESVSLDGDRKGRAVVRFGNSARATEIFQDVVDGIRSKVSVGYQIHHAVLEHKSDEGPDTYRVDDWEPFEVSIVSIPADATVGVGRASVASDYEFDVEIQEDKPMTEEVKTPEPAQAEKIDVRAIHADAVSQERQRISEITAIGSAHGQADLARQFVDNGKPLDEFRTALLDKISTAAPMTKSSADSEIGLTDKERQEFSFVRAIRAMANPTDQKLQRDAAFEFEVSRAAADQYRKDPQGILVPMDVLRHNKRDLTVGTNSAGGYLKGTDHLGASFIELLRNRMVLRELGARSLEGLTGDVAIPSQTAGATAYWISSEGTAPSSESALTFGQVALSPHTVGAYVDYTRKLMLQGDPSIEALVRDDLSAQLAIAVDAAGINGSGSSGQPTGILNTTGIGDVALGTNGDAPTWASVVNLIREVEVDNAAMGNLSYLTNPKAVAKLRTTAKVASTDSMMIMGEGSNLLGYGVESSNQVPSTLDKGTSTGVCSAMIFGNFADLILAEWSGIDLLVDPYTASNTGTTRVTAFYDVDVGVRHAASFAAIQDMLTT